MTVSFDVLLWDVDGTLLDFLAAEDISIRSLFHDFKIGECTDEMISRYSQINASYWKKLEKGEMTRAEILVKRFETFFEEIGAQGVDCLAFDRAYQKRLGETVVFRDDSYQLVSFLKGRIPQYAVSNGTVVAQTGKLTKSGLINLFDGVFLSEHLGCEKPSALFFDKVFASIPAVDRRRVLIVGDSLSSDILGAKNAGIQSCWYNPFHAANQSNITPDFEIDNLQSIPKLIGIENN